LDDALHALLSDALASGVGSAAALSVGDAGVEIVRIALGTTRTHPDHGAPIGDHASFDVASLTKPMSTAAIAMALVSEERLDLDAPVQRWLPIVDGRITVAHLLGHAGGFPAHRKIYELCGGSSRRRAAVLPPTRRSTSCTTSARRSRSPCKRRTTRNAPGSMARSGCGAPTASVRSA
jgi:CubicO group peptidase (beta-lactamase class C family)